MRFGHGINGFANRGLVSVELPRHSHAAPAVASRSIDALRAAWSSQETAGDRP